MLFFFIKIEIDIFLYTQKCFKFKKMINIYHVIKKKTMEIDQIFLEIYYLELYIFLYIFQKYI